MKISDLLISCVHITEDNYHYKGQFILNAGGRSINVDLSDIDDNDILSYIKDYFSIVEQTREIRNNLISRLVEKAGISSKIVEGENYFESKALR